MRIRQAHDERGIRFLIVMPLIVTALLMILTFFTSLRAVFLQSRSFQVILHIGSFIDLISFIAIACVNALHVYFPVPH